MFFILCRVLNNCNVFQDETTCTHQTEYVIILCIL